MREVVEDLEASGEFLGGLSVEFKGWLEGLGRDNFDAAIFISSLFLNFFNIFNWIFELFEGWMVSLHLFDFIELVQTALGLHH